MAAEVAEYKKRNVSEFVKLIKDYPIVGVVNMENLPALQLQKMRALLRGEVKLLMGKKRLMRLALEDAKQAKPGIEKLSDCMLGMPALIFTRENPFKLASILRKSKSMAPVKPGQLAPNDIIIPKGPTSFGPGPIISELSQVGLKTGIERGKVAIKEEKMVAKKGEPVKPKVAEVLARLGIEPMEVGLDLVAIFEDGIIYNKEVLSIDEAQYLNNIRTAASEAMALAIGISYYTKDTIKVLISKVVLESRALKQNIKIETTEEQLVRAEEQAEKIAEVIKEKIPEEELEEKVEVKEEVPQKELSDEEKQFEDIKKKMEWDKKIAEVVEKEKKEKREEAKREKEKEEVEKVEKFYDKLKKKGSLRKGDGGN